MWKELDKKQFLHDIIDGDINLKEGHYVYVDLGENECYRIDCSMDIFDSSTLDIILTFDGIKFFQKIVDNSNTM